MAYAALPAANVEAAESLVMPYACSVDRGDVRLTPAAEHAYRVLGVHEETTVPVCQRAGRWSCEPVAAHKFLIDCGRERLSWARVAAAAERLGIKIHAKLPAGFAPVSHVGARFVFPGDANSATALMPVAISNLPDHETAHATDQLAVPSSWVTVIKSDEVATAGATSGGGVAVATLATLAFLVMATFLAASVLAPRFASTQWPGAWPRAWPRAWMTGTLSKNAFGSAWANFWAAYLNMVEPLAAVISRVCDIKWPWLAKGERQFKQRAGPSERQSSPHPHDSVMQEGIRLVLIAIEKTETIVENLGAAPKLREVLRTELHRVHQRLVGAETTQPPLTSERMASLVRVLLKDLERIQRIGDSAVASVKTPNDTIEMPRTRQDAFDLLGLNADAPPHVAKKLVDALRATWHPDYARDEADRVKREDRMKQINCAWDLITVRRAAA